MPFQESELLAWKQGSHEMLLRSQASPFLKRILVEKARNRNRPNRRFFGEAFVAAHVEHERGWYGSFKWLTSAAWTREGYTSEYAGEYRTALREYFPSVSELQSGAAEICKMLQGRKPVAPDLWLIVNGEHRFIEVKLPRDNIRPSQVAGLALIARSLSRNNDVSVWLINLHPEGRQPGPISEGLEALYNKFYRSGGRPNNALEPSPPV